ncbi:argonaute 4A [Spatholobus suberectus]|nr:argonaute 4A [Spatholobus suberectus]
MACSYVSDERSIDSAFPSLEHVPLAQRRKLLHSPTLQNDTCRTLTCTPTLQSDAVVKKEHEDGDSQVMCPTFETDASRVEKTGANVSILARCPTLSAFDGRATIKVEDYEIPSSSVDKGREASIQLDFPTPKVKKEIPEGIVDDLDHIVLKERLRMLLTRKLPGLPNTAFEGSNGGLLETIMEQTVKKVNEEINSADGKAAVAREQCYDIPEGINTSLPLVATCGSSLLTDYASSKSTGSVISAGLQEDNHILKSRGTVMQFDPHVEHNVINNDGPISPTFVKVKDESWDYSENHNVNKDAMSSISIELPNVKSEWEVHNEYHDGQAEHMNLIDRLNFLMAGVDSSLNISTSYSSLKKTNPSSSISSSIFSKSAEPSNINCRRKRKKTATDSVQEALEEDAPGLLQVLLDKGVLVDEIKLYGEKEDDEALDESFCEDSFSELEAVMTKIFSQRHSLLKFPITRASKASRASYCLACLISLVEQVNGFLQTYSVQIIAFILQLILVLCMFIFSARHDI